MSSFQEKALRTNGRTDATPKVSTTSWSRDQKAGKTSFLRGLSEIKKWFNFFNQKSKSIFIDHTKLLHKQFLSNFGFYEIQRG